MNVQQRVQLSTDKIAVPSLEFWPQLAWVNGMKFCAFRLIFLPVTIVTKRLKIR